MNTSYRELQKRLQREFAWVPELAIYTPQELEKIYRMVAGESFYGNIPIPKLHLNHLNVGGNLSLGDNFKNCLNEPACLDGAYTIEFKEGNVHMSWDPYPETPIIGYEKIVKHLADWVKKDLGITKYSLRLDKPEDSHMLLHMMLEYYASGDIKSLYEDEAFQELMQVRFDCPDDEVYELVFNDDHNRNIYESPENFILNHK